jgi:glycosyltransferase involved in cell wall biosynthesis
MRNSDMDSILISFIIAVYNNERFLPNAIDSILQQAVDGIEVIIVDDGSTDNSGVIADKYAKENQCVRVVHQQNQWIYASFNNGIKEAEGEYIYILNSDDILFDESVELMLRKIDEFNHPDVIWTKVVSSWCDGNQIVTRNHSFPTTEPIEEETYAVGNEVQLLWPKLRLADLCENQANLYKKRLAINHPFRNDIYTADQYFNFAIANDVHSCLVLKEPVYHYMMFETGKGNTSIKYYEYEHKMRTDLYKKYRRLFENWGLDESDYMKSLKVDRMRYYTAAIRCLARSGCKMSINDKVKTVLMEYLDEDLLDCAEWADCRRELESRTLNGINELLKNEGLPERSEMSFVYELISGLPDNYYEDVDFDKIDIERIRKAAYHPLNPAHIGEVYYKLR